MTEKKKSGPEAANDPGEPKTETQARAADTDSAAELDEAAISAARDAPAETDAGDGDRVAALEAEVAELKDRQLRALAEVENIRRRSTKEREDALKYAATNFAKEMLSVADNLRRALDSIPADAADADANIKNLVTGVELTEKELLSAFERQGIKRIEAEGQKFDHNLHQAMMEVPDSGKPAGTVVQVVQTGYTIHDRLLRPAMVGVAKGDPGGKGDAKGSKVDTSA